MTCTKPSCGVDDNVPCVNNCYCKPGFAREGDNCIPKEYCLSKNF